MNDPHEQPTRPAAGDGTRTGWTDSASAGEGSRRSQERPAWLPEAPAPHSPSGAGEPLPGDAGARPWREGLSARNPLPAPTMPRRALRLELGLVMLLAFMPAILGLLFGVTAAEPPERQPSIGQAVAAVLLTIFFTWSPLVVLGYLLRNNREGPATLGLTRPGARDLGAGLLLWMASHAVVLVLSPLFSALGTNEVQFLPEGLPIWFLSVQSLVIAVTAGVTEEVLVRGYAQTRLEQLGLPAGAVVLVPTALWSVLHVYQGVGAAATIFGLGMLWAVWFHRTRRLWPLILAHTLFDLVGLVLILATR